MQNDKFHKNYYIDIYGKRWLKIFPSVCCRNFKNYLINCDETCKFSEG